jgi:hypothetical protein
MDNTNNQQLRIQVDRGRLSSTGDITRACSADIICTTFNTPPKIRQPFNEQGRWYATMSVLGSSSAIAYELIPTPADAPEEVGNDHLSGRKVQFGGEFFTLRGPVSFVAKDSFDEHINERMSTNSSFNPQADIQSNNPELFSITQTQGLAPVTLPTTEVIRTNTSTVPIPSPNLFDNAGKNKLQVPDKVESSINTVTTNSGLDHPLDRSYDLNDASFKIFMTFFAGSDDARGREIRITTQVYDHAPVFRRVRGLEAGSVPALVNNVIAEISSTLPSLKQTYTMQQMEIARQEAARKEKELADKIRKQSKTVNKPTALGAQDSQKNLSPDDDDDIGNDQEQTDSNTQELYTDNTSSPLVSTPPTIRSIPSTPVSSLSKPSNNSSNQGSLFG